MNMELIQLRGHHLFCLLGFRGMGYSEAYAMNMKDIHQQLREQPHTIVRVISGADDLCAKFPCDQPYHCDAMRVFEQDQAFLHVLQLRIGDELTWQDIEKRMQTFATPDLIERVCFDCQWRKYGVCEEGIVRIQHGDGLPELS